MPERTSGLIARNRALLLRLIWREMIRLKIDRNSERQFLCTARSSRSSSSATSQKISESLVKLRLATYAREMQ